MFPYDHYALTPRLGFWATAGYGWGERSFEPDDDTEYNPDTTMAMAAAGINGVLLDGGSEGTSVTTTADVLTLKATSEEVDELASSEGSLSHLRIGLEATRPVPLANGASLLPYAWRWASGKTVVIQKPALAWIWGLALSGRSRVGHQQCVAGTYPPHPRRWGFPGPGPGPLLPMGAQPSPANLGPSLSMRHSMGATTSGGMDALLNPVTMEFPGAVSSSR